MRRKPQVTLREMKVWIHVDASYNWNDVKRACLNNFLKRTMDKFRETGSMKIKEGRGRNGLSLTKAKKIESKRHVVESCLLRGLKYYLTQ